MITPGFAPGCPSALHRGLWLLVANGAFDRVTWPQGAAGLALTLLPGVLVSIVALWAWRGGRMRAVAAVIVAATVVHAPLAIVLMPLLVRAVAGAWRDYRAWLSPLAIIAASAIVGFLATPPCHASTATSWAAILREGAAVYAIGAGPLVLLLTAFGFIGQPRSEEARALTWVTASGIVALLIVPRFDCRVTLMPSLIACWWLATAAVRHQLALRPAWATRAGAAVVLVCALLLHPVRQVLAANASAATTRDTTPLSVPAVRQALDGTAWPATVVSEDAGHDSLLNVWRSAGRGRQGALDVARLDADALGSLGPSRPIYAFRKASDALRDRGFRFAPLPPPAGGTEPLLWRAVDYVPCVVLTTSWQDVTAHAADGQIVTAFTQGGTPRTAQFYAALAERPDPRPVNWPEGDYSGFRARVFELSVANDRAELDKAAQAEGTELARLLAGARFVVRLNIFKTVFSPGSLRTLFGAPVLRTIGNMNLEPGYGDVVRLCRSTRDEVVIGDTEAARLYHVPLTASPPFGAGWHGPEIVNDEAFRWTAGDAQLHVFLTGPQPLTLRLDALSPLGELAQSDLVVELNGKPAACSRPAPPCDWQLPLEAMQRGRNTITLRSRTTQASPGDTRQVGLMIRRLELAR